MVNTSCSAWYMKMLHEHTYKGSVGHQYDQTWNCIRRTHTGPCTKHSNELMIHLICTTCTESMCMHAQLQHKYVNITVSATLYMPNCPSTMRLLLGEDLWVIQ